MATIQVVLDEPLLEAADHAAKRAKVNRSALMRDALRAYLKKLEIREKEHLDRQGYELQPDSAADAELWAKVASWPDE